MTGRVHWLPLAIPIVAALPILYLWIRNRRQERGYVVEHTRALSRTGQPAGGCTVVRDAASGEPVGIQTCSAARGVRCDKACLPLFAHRMRLSASPRRAEPDDR
jgi:hypothetical protein